MNRLALLTVLVAFTVSVQAAPETYVIDNSQTVANFSISYLGMSNKTAQIRQDQRQGGVRSA